MTPISTRRATVADLAVLVADVQAGFDSYVAFAPLGWVPPDVYADTEVMAELLADIDTWALIALSEAEPVGHIAFTPARRRAPGRAWASSPATPGRAHLWQLFVLPEWWGRGVAALLHAAAITEIRARGYSAVRLYTPSLHARARRFYERRGWRAVGEHWNHQLTLMVTEYERDLV
ncbi:MAG TPA: GNAT family N-acetyltransferase [Solirubrobacteraceae bacterium]|nr:GNAT family N-acetyltransferase [Solirubrobacteraceae bacterium]